MLEMIKEAQQELLHYPERSMGYYVKRRLKLIMGRGAEPIDKINWPNGLLAKGLIDYYMGHKNSDQAREIREVLQAYYDGWIKNGHKMYYLDDALSGMALIELHQITGEERYRQAADEMMRFLSFHITDNAGSLLYRPNQKNGYVFVDSIGMICPFLCKYGHTYGDAKAIGLAVTQIQNFVDFGMDGKTGLPYHGYKFEDGLKYGIIGWGRAVGWLMIGMSESLAFMDETSPDYEYIKQIYRRLVDKVESYQLENGLYCWQLGAKEGPVDTSATAMILYSIAQSLNMKVLIGIHRSRMLRGREALLGMVKEGKLDNALAECQGFSLYPQVYGAYPWSLGPALSLFAVTSEEKDKKK